MPKYSINYQNNIIYKFVCNDLSVSDIFIDSTTDMRRRKQQHKSKCNNEEDKSYNLQIYQTIRNNGGFLNWSMIQIEKFPCIDKAESKLKERYWFEMLSIKKKKQEPFLYSYKDNIDEFNEFQKKAKELLQTNQESKINQCRCACGGKYMHISISTHKKSKKHLLFIQNSNNIKIINLNNQMNIIE